MIFFRPWQSEQPWNWSRWFKPLCCADHDSFWWLWSVSLDVFSLLLSPLIFSGILEDFGLTFFVCVCVCGLTFIPTISLLPVLLMTFEPRRQKKMLDVYFFCCKPRTALKLNIYLCRNLMFPQVLSSHWHCCDAVHTVALGLGTKTVWISKKKKKKIMFWITWFCQHNKG